MVIVEICVGSSCHIRGSQEIVELMQNAIEQGGLDGEVVLSGSFCTGKCNREGVSVTVNHTVYTGITKETFKDFFRDTILKAVKEGS